VIGTGRNVEALSLLKANGDVVDFIVADVTSPGACQRIVDQASERLGGLTTVVNAAGILKGGPMGRRHEKLRFEHEHKLPGAL
jgi:NAD(P)-dependent dehydrogenase (short-subunit alcohol dehydrogenase family)